MSTPVIEDFRNQFEAAFFEPSKRCWKSELGVRVLVETEHLADALAGPLDSIARRGECAYVYLRDDDYFRGVNDPSDLESRLREWHFHLTEAIERFEPNNRNEQEDLEAIKQMASDMWTVAVAGCAIERQRWLANPA